MSRLVGWLSRQDGSLMFIAFAVASAIVLGGGGSPAPLAEMILQVLLALAFVGWFWTAPRKTVVSASPMVWVLAGVVLALPLAQLIPLPPSVWQALPGRADEKAALDLIGQGQSWQAISIAPYRTWSALLAMVGPVAFMVVGASLSPSPRAIVLAIIGAMAGLSILVGAAQLGGGMWSFLRFYSPDSTMLDGFQANHNAQADLLLIAMVALTTVLVDMKVFAVLRRRLHLLTALLILTIVFVCAIVLTGSRAGMALIPLALAGQLAILWPLLALSRRGIMLGVAGLLLAVAGAGLMVESNTALGGAVSRFRQGDPLRPEIWQNTLYAIKANLPLGTGMGTFIPAYTAAEKLETVTEQLINRAHDDYLELALEGGIPALVLALFVVTCVVWRAWPLRSGGDLVLRSQRICASVGLMVIGLHSIVDYPLRAMSLACVAGLLTGFLFSARANQASALQRPLGEVKESL